MYPANLIVFTLCLAPSIESASSQRRNKWSKARVGEGVSVEAHIIYDSSVKPQGLSERNNDERKNEDTLADFKKLFQLVQQHFHNESVMVTFEVKTAIQNDTLPVKSGNKSLNATQTLKKLIEYAAVNSSRNDSIFYFFTANELLEKTKQGDKVDIDHADVATFGTFCSEKDSAAVVKYYPLSDTTRHISAVEATARIFGLKKYKNLNIRDILQLLLTFGNCPRSDCWTQCLQPVDETDGN
uniref:28 kDa Metastriate family member n=1 Tax=Rhipicephalus appendiculatus TaxID=34631 RepID=A0A131Z7D0_RHIAP